MVGGRTGKLKVRWMNNPGVRCNGRVVVGRGRKDGVR